MKKSILTSSLFAGLLLLSFGCLKVADPNKDLDLKLAQIDSDLKKQLADLDKLQTSIFSDIGGLPGKITLNGVAVIDTDKIDSRITVSQTAGLDKSGSATLTVAKDSLILKNISNEQIETNRKSLTETEAKKSYINIGCELAESEIAGLTDISKTVDLSKSAILTASRVFICGELKITNLLLIISASDIMLKDASITQSISLGIVSVNAKSLVLLGKNKIQTIGENSSLMVTTAASIDLYVDQEIYGDGSLALESAGGNNVKQ